MHLLHYRRLGAGGHGGLRRGHRRQHDGLMVRPTLENAPPTPETAEAAEPEARLPRTDAGTHRCGQHRPDARCWRTPTTARCLSILYRITSISPALRTTAIVVMICAQTPAPMYWLRLTVLSSQAAEHYSWGNFVVIDHGTNGEGYSWRTLYAHLQSLYCGSRTACYQGQIIGYVGSTGRTTGNQCHFEVYVDNTLTSPRWFTAYHGEGDSAEPTDEERQELIDRCVDAKAIRCHAHDG